MNVRLEEELPYLEGKLFPCTNQACFEDQLELT